MKSDTHDQITRWMTELRSTLSTAAELVERGRAAYDTDPALRLAFEALSNRVGDLAKRLVALDPERFNAPIWSAAARNRDLVAHSYHRVDYDLLWATVAQDFGAMGAMLDELSEPAPAPRADRSRATPPHRADRGGAPSTGRRQSE